MFILSRRFACGQSAPLGEGSVLGRHVRRRDIWRVVAPSTTSARQCASQMQWFEQHSTSGWGASGERSVESRQLATIGRGHEG